VGVWCGGAGGCVLFLGEERAEVGCGGLEFRRRVGLKERRCCSPSGVADKGCLLLGSSRPLRLFDGLKSANRREIRANFFTKGSDAYLVGVGDPRNGS
jgi:hypothetical protein